MGEERAAVLGGHRLTREQERAAGVVALQMGDVVRDMRPDGLLGSGEVEPEQVRHGGLRRFMDRVPMVPARPSAPHGAPGAGQRERPGAPHHPTPGHASYAVMY